MSGIGWQELMIVAVVVIVIIGVVRLRSRAN
jgi:Sec-independent protein translocase protein TatA